MPHVLNITNGETTIPLSTDGVQLKHFVPQTAKKLKTPVGTDDYDDVAEAIELLYYGSDTEAVQALHRQVETMLNQAGDRYGPRTYLQYRPIGDPYTWRAEIRAGATVTLADNAMTAFGQAKVEARILLTRRGFWEGPFLEAALSSPLATVVGGGGKKINMGGQNNYVTAPSGNILGNLRTPAYLQLNNNNGSIQQPRQIYISTTGDMAHAPYSDLLGDFEHILEAEDATGGTVINGGATASGGQLLEVSFTGANNVTWTISEQAAYALSGREFRILARFNWYPTGMPIYVRPTIPGLALPGDEVQLPSPTREFVDLGSLRLPSSRFGRPAATTLQLGFRCASTVLIELDYIQLTLANPGLRVIDYLGGNLAANERIHDDATEGLAYTLSGVYQRADVAVYGSPIWLYPTIWPQRIYVMTDTGFNAPVAKFWNLRIYYRPRRLTI